MEAETRSTIHICGRDIRVKMVRKEGRIERGKGGRREGSREGREVGGKD